MEVKKVYRETMPLTQLVGKRYTQKDRDENGTFARNWQRWFSEGWFNTLMPHTRSDYIGAMRMTNACSGEFEYWIGVFCSPDTMAPAGFDSVELPEGKIGVCWLCGNEQSGELYSEKASELSMNALKEQGWEYDEKSWFFERYNPQRFSEPDEAGNVILDICAYLI